MMLTLLAYCVWIMRIIIKIAVLILIFILNWKMILILIIKTFLRIILIKNHAKKYLT